MLNNLLLYLQKENYKSYYLAFLRVFVSIWLLLQVLFNINNWELFYSVDTTVKVSPTGFVNLIRLDADFLKTHYLWLIGICIIGSILNALAIGRQYTAVLLYVSYNMLYALNNKITNSGNNMALLLSFYLCFANTYNHFAWKKKPKQNHTLGNFISNLAAYAILINLCISYAFAGLAKLQDANWQDGTAIHYVLNNYRFASFSFNSTLGNIAWFVYFTTYATLVVEISFSFFVWIKKYRPYILCASFLMHAFIYSFMSIHAMSVIFVIQYGLFFNDEDLKLHQLFIAKNRS